MALNALGLGFVFSAKDLASAVIKDVEKRFNSLTDTSDKAAQKLRDHAGGMAGVGAGIGAIGSAGLLFFGMAENAAQKFGKGIAGVRTLIDENVISTKKLEDMALGMNAAYGGGIDEQINALYQGLSSGATNAATATSLLDASNKLAIGGVAGVGESLDGLTNTLNAFSIDYAKATDVADAFFVATKIGKTTVKELSATVGGLAPTAASLGVSFDDMLSSIAAVTTQGLNTASAVTGLKAAMANIIKPTKDAADEAKRLGITFSAKALRETQGGFPAFLAKITSNAKYSKDTMAELFGSVEGLNAVMALSANGGKQLNQTLEEMKNRSGAAEKAFQTMAATSDFQAERTKSLTQNAMILIGKALEPMEVAFRKVMNAALEAFNNIPGPVRDTIVRVLAAAAGVAALVGGVIAAKAAFAIWIVGLKLAGVTLASVAWAVAPLLLAIGAITLAFYAFREAYDQNLGGFADKVDAAWSKIRLAFLGISQLFSKGAFSGSVMKELNAAGNGGVKAFVINVFMWFSRLKNLFSGVAAGFAAGVTAAKPAIDGFMNALRKLGTAFGFLSKNDGPKKNLDTWMAFGEIGGKIGSALAKAFGYIVEAGTWVIDVATGMMDTFKKSGGVVDALVGSGQALWDALGEIASAFGAGDSGTSGAAFGFGQVLGDVIGVIGMLIAIIVSVAAALGSVLASAISGIIAMVKTLWNTLMALGAILVAVSDGDWATAWYAMKDVVAGVVKFIIQGLAAIFGAIGGFTDAIGKAFGADLGLKKAIEGGAADMQRDLDVKLGLKTDPVKIPSATRPSAGPAVAAAQADAASSAALQATLANVGNVDNSTQHITVPVVLDGEKIAEAMVSKGAKGKARSFAPQAIPG